MIALLLAAVSLSAEPSLLRLGLDGKATLRIHAPCAPVLSASAGSVSAPRASGDGFEADYTPPDDAVPQVGIVSAICADELGWVAIPLWGQGDALVKTRRGASISVRIGAQEFGPAIANDEGEALVPVVVPPGVQQAWHGKRPIELQVPPSRTLHAALARGTALADREERVAVFVVAVTPQGVPREDAPVQLRVDRGSLTALRGVMPGVLEAEWTLPPGAPGVARLTASVGDELPAEVALPVVPGPAVRVDVTPAQSALTAGEGPVTLHVAARDAAGNPSPDTLRFETSFGEVEGSPEAPGEWNLTVRVPAELAGHDSLTVRAAAAAAEARAAVKLSPAAPATAKFADAPPLARADGATAVLLRVDLRDRYGNVVKATSPEVRVEQGHAQVMLRDGVFLASWVPPLLHERSTSRLAVRAGAAAAETQFLLTPKLRAGAASPRLGWLTDLAGTHLPFAGVEAAVRSEALGPQLSIALSADYGFQARTEVVLTSVPATSRLDLALFAAAAAWRMPLLERGTWWLSAGPSLAAIWTRASLASSSPRKGFATRPGAVAGVGAEWRFRAAIPYAELRLGATQDPALPTLQGSFRYFTLSAGVRLEVF